MKKSDLSDIINRKKILKESLDIIKESISGMDEIGGYDSTDLASHFHGNYIDELNKVFLRFDEISNSLGDAISKTIDDDEIKRSREVLVRYIDFMESFLNYIVYLNEKHISGIADYMSKPYKPDLGDIGDLKNMEKFRLNENKKRSR